jgi:hypothetical protein
VFGGFCLLFLFLAMPGASRVVGVVCFFASLILVLGQIFLNVPFGFCLESLILAQDERWRRA